MELQVKPSQEPERIARIIDKILGPGTGSPPGFDGHLLPGDASKLLEVSDVRQMESLGNNPAIHLISPVRQCARSWQN